ncbi:hypothetical protein KCQ_00545 [Pectobacterium atrosepticum ICMP 1526]|nr:hypothetical protein KCQ_00545 [Pectobacterium atrosepticum ICMP 1526]
MAPDQDGNSDNGGKYQQASDTFGIHSDGLLSPGCAGSTIYPSYFTLHVRWLSYPARY